MKTTHDSTGSLRSLIRWSTGIGLASAIIFGSCLLFPALFGNAGVLLLTSSLAVIIGLQVALPPLDPEEDWVHLGRHRKQVSARRETMASNEEKTSTPRPEPAPAGELNTSPVLLAHPKRSYGSPQWGLYDDLKISREKNRSKAPKRHTPRPVAGLVKLLGKN